MTKFTIFLFIFFCFSIEVSANYFVIQDSSLISDTTQVDTTSILSDSLKTAAPRDTLRPIKLKALSIEKNFTAFFTRNQILKTDYRYSGDIFNHLPFGYLADLGTVGNPSEVYLYGLGFQNISYLQNGIPINNRYQNALDLNLIQSESIDSIEVPSISSGFFYNLMNNPVSVNFNSRLKVDPRPYSRLRFYQGPENEGFIDGLFSAYPMKRINVSFQVTNQSSDPRYNNTELSNWLFNTRIRYMPSNKINFIVGYELAKLEMGLNGGVDVTETPALVFDNILAAVNYEDRYHKNIRYNIFAKSLIKFDSLSYTDITFYHRNELDEFRQNEQVTDTTAQRIKHNNVYNSYGLMVNQKLHYSLFNLNLLGRYEKTDYEVERNSNFFTRNIWSIGGKLNINLLDRNIVPSLFMKITDSDGQNLFGVGANLSLNINKYLQLQAGFSKYERYYGIYNFTGNVEVLETSLKSHLPFGQFDLTYFNISQSDYFFPVVDTINIAYSNPYIGQYLKGDFERSGINFRTDINIWKIKLLSNSSYYFNESKLAEPHIPKITSFGGIYYVDTLFNNNLDLKTGINYKFYDERKFSVYDFELLERAFFDINGNQLIGFNNSTNTKIGYQFDFFLAGTIQKRATIYFVFENLFDYQYYVVPYYPIQPSGLRLGFTWEFLD